MYTVYIYIIYIFILIIYDNICNFKGYTSCILRMHNILYICLINSANKARWCQPWTNEPQTAAEVEGYHFSISLWFLEEYTLNSWTMVHKIRCSHFKVSPPDLGVSMCGPRDERIRVVLYWDIDGMLASLRSLLWGRAHDGQVILIQESIHPALQPSSNRSTAGRVPSSRVPEFRSDLSAIRDKQVQIRTLQPKLVPQEYFHVAVAISGPKRWRSFQVRSTFRCEKPQN